MNPGEQHKPLEVLILAAGLGTRMRSRRAKVLHELGGLPLIAHVCRAAQALEPQRIFVVVGHQAAEVEEAVRTQVGDLARFVLQAQQRGTGDAVEAARDVLENSDSLLLILSGDVPLVRPDTLAKLIEHHRATGSDCTILSVRQENPTGYGRVVRDDQNSFVRVVEHKDATMDQRQIREINSGIYCFGTRKLFEALKRIEPANEQGAQHHTQFDD